jgi:hypothetical protein
MVFGAGKHYLRFLFFRAFALCLPHTQRLRLLRFLLSRQLLNETRFISRSSTPRWPHAGNLPC